MPINEWLDHIDKIMFLFIHRTLSAHWLDEVMLLIRNPYVWIPLYVYMLYWALRTDRGIAVKFILFTFVCFAITDFTSAHLFKPLFERLRPCYDEDTAGMVRGIIGCGGKYSFPSNHAANHFGLAAFWYSCIYFLTNRKWYWLWLWAFCIGYAQVYVGKHFPFDIAGGALFGIATGCGLFKLFEGWIRRDHKKYLENHSLSLPGI